MTEDMWGTGDYKSVADKVASIGEVLVQRADIGQGMEVLDVACGAGNATIPAASRPRRPKASSRHCSGGPRITCASYLATIRNSSVTRSSGTNPSPESYAEFMETKFPPLIAARSELGDELLHETFLGWVKEANEADDGSLRYRGEYLLAVVGP